MEENAQPVQGNIKGRVPVWDEHLYPLLSRGVFIRRVNTDGQVCDAMVCSQYAGIDPDNSLPVLELITFNYYHQ